MAIVADTSCILASIDRNEPAHLTVRQILESDRGPFIVPELVIAEVDYLVLRHHGPQAEKAFLEDIIHGAWTREPLAEEDLVRGLEVIHRYRAEKLGIVDATILAVAERLNIETVLTLDLRHFRALKFRDRKPLQLLPADLS